MMTSNPFWLVHSWCLDLVTEFCWRQKYRNELLTPPKLAIRSIMIGLTLIIGAVAAIETVSLLFTPVFLLAPLTLHSDLERKYLSNTKNGLKNSLQNEWPFMIATNLLLLGMFMVTLAVNEEHVIEVRLCALGLYMSVVVTIYILATDPPPRGYQPDRKNRLQTA